MILYPILTSWLNMDEKNTGIFLGATIHDVAQVIGAGYSVSDLTGDTATLIKLFRVTLLFPLVLIISFFIKASKIQKNNSSKTPLVPGFIILFILCLILNSLGAIPNSISYFLSDLSKLCLLIAVAAVGAKTKLQNLKVIGLTPAFLIVVNSLFLLIFVIICI